MPTIGLTASSQLKSANATTEIAYHSGKENRGKLKHKNEDIDPTRSHLNVGFDVLSREELLETHYREKIDNHNKHNRGPSRRWDTMEDFLKTFEGKKVKFAGKETDNERWATMSQITYVGNKETMGFRTDRTGKDAVVGEVWDHLMHAGVSEEEIRNAYVEGYKEYVQKHNEKFPTLPIYRSDIHFDETTPHGHDAIVVMGHTESGKPSDSLNNALGEHYGYANSMDGKKRNLEQYRLDNDSIATLCISRKLKEVAVAYNVDISFKAERTGQTFSMDMHNYKLRMDEFDKRQKELDEEKEIIDKRLKEQNEKLRERYEQGFADAVKTMREIADGYHAEEGKRNWNVFTGASVAQLLEYTVTPNSDAKGNERSIKERVIVANKAVKEREAAEEAKRKEQERVANELAAKQAELKGKTKPVITRRTADNDGPEL